MSVEYDIQMDIDEFEDYFHELPSSIQQKLVKDYILSLPILKAMTISYIQDETNSESDRKKVENFFGLSLSS